VPTGLLLLAHGSTDPRHAATLRAVADDVRGDVEADVALGFLEHDSPSAAEALQDLTGTNRRVVAVSLLLADGFHAEVDVPAVLAQAPAHRPVEHAGTLGLGPWLVPVLERRASSAGAAPGSDRPVVLCAAGSSRDAAREQVADLAQQWSALRRTPVTVAFATGPGPSLAEALTAAGRPAVVVPLLLCEGGIYDRIVDGGRAHAAIVTPAIAPANELTDRIVALARGQVVLPDTSVSV